LKIPIEINCKYTKEVLSCKKIGGLESQIKKTIKLFLQLQHELLFLYLQAVSEFHPRISFYKSLIEIFPHFFFYCYFSKFSGGMAGEYIEIRLTTIFFPYLSFT